MNNRLIVTGIALLLILTTALIASQSPNTNPPPTSTPTPIPTNSDTDAVPLNWTQGYDDSLRYQFAHPNDWDFRPATSITNESAFYSFDLENTPDVGGISADELKIAVNYFSSDDPRSIDFDESEIRSETSIMVDNRRATRRVLISPGGGSITTTVEVDGATYLISAYPPDSRIVEIYDEFLNQIRLDMNPPITIQSPELGETVDSPLTVEGQVSGSWFFEDQLPIRLETVEGNLIAQTNATSSTGNWMTIDPVPFSTTISFTTQEEDEGVLVISKSNASGLPENEYSFYRPVKFSP